MKHVYLLPNLFTTGNLFCGVYAILLALNGRPASGAWFILAAIFFDFLDGHVARIKNAVSRFGLEYDSLADLVSFGLAPIVTAYLLFLRHMGHTGVGLIFIYTACIALRLARFNTIKPTAEKSDFIGLPSPAAGGTIAAMIIFIQANPSSNWIYIVPIVTLFLSLFMVSSFRYPSLKIINLWKKSPFLNLVLIVIFFGIALFHLQLFLLISFFAYTLSGVLIPRSLKRTVLKPKIGSINNSL